MQKLNKRQLKALDFIKSQERVTNRKIKEYLEEIFGSLSRITIVRDINQLLKQDIIVKKGKGRGVWYEETIKNKLLSYFDVDEYFKKGPDERRVLFERFNFDIFKDLKDIFTKDELEELKKLNNNYRERVKKLTPTIFKKEFERITIELSWKSSQIEGNTYSLIDTEILIKENREAGGHKKEEAIMILNHKKALDYILDRRSDFNKITLRKIENIHNLVVEDLGVPMGVRKKPVGVVGTKYRPLDNQHQIIEALGKFIRVVNKLKEPFSKAILAMLLISYIQPFEDGNKRTARLLGDAILLANNICPLSFRSIDEHDYKKAMILFYEQNGARFFKELFIEQFKFAVNNYFLG